MRWDKMQTDTFEYVWRPEHGHIERTTTKLHAYLNVI